MPAYVYEDKERRPPALQMAIDEAILRTSGAPVLRIYRWAAPAVSFGYGLRLREVQQSFPGTPLVRRWTGGGMVPHGEDVTFTIFIPSGGGLCRMRPSESYEEIHRKVLQAIAPLLSGLHLVLPGEVREGAACFESASRHDILQGTRKLCGGAQRRSREGLLHQGSIQGVVLPEDFGRTLADEFLPGAIKKTFPSELLSLAEELAATRYSSPEWLEKR